MARENLLTRFGGGLAQFGEALSGRVDPILEAQRQQQQRQQLGGILAGQTIPAFARAEETPEQIQQAQLAQLANLGTPEALAAIGQISPLAQKPAAPLSPAGKIQADINAGRISPEIGQQLLAKATAPRAPLVTISTGEKNKARQTRDQLSSGIKAVDKLIAELKASPTKAGIVGVGRGALETGAGVIADIAKSIPGFGGLGESVAGLLPDIGKSIRGLKPLQNKLAIGLARARQGDTGRLLSEQLKAAKTDTSIAGVTSGQQALESLEQVRKELIESQSALFGRAAEVGFDLPPPKDATEEVIPTGQSIMAPGGQEVITPAQAEAELKRRGL